MQIGNGIRAGDLGTVGGDPTFLGGMVVFGEPLSELRPVRKLQQKGNVHRCIQFDCKDTTIFGHMQVLTDFFENKSVL